MRLAFSSISSLLFVDQPLLLLSLAILSKALAVLVKIILASFVQPIPAEIHGEASVRRFLIAIIFLYFNLNNRRKKSVTRHFSTWNQQSDGTFTNIGTKSFAHS